MEKEKEVIADEVLVVAAILGDLQAFDQLVERYRRVVKRLAESIAGSKHADDIAQDTWLMAFKSLPSIDNPQKFASWLMVITKHRALRQREKESKRNARFMPVDEYLLEQFGSIKDEQARQEEGEIVRMALDQIPQDYSMVMRMRFYDTVPLNKIASFLDLPLSTIKWRIHKGKALLLERVKQIQDTEEAWRNR